MGAVIILLYKPKIAVQECHPTEGQLLYKGRFKVVSGVWMTGNAKFDKLEISNCIELHLYTIYPE